MKHRILFRRIQAVILSVAMLTSMCTTGYAAEPENSPAEAVDTAVTYSTDQTDTVLEDVGAGEDGADEAQKDMGEDGGQTEVNDNEGQDSDGGQGSEGGENDGQSHQDPEAPSDNGAGSETDGAEVPGEDTEVPSHKDDDSGTEPSPSENEGESSENPSGKEENPSEDSSDQEENPSEDSAGKEDEPSETPSDNVDTPSESPSDQEESPSAVPSDQGNNPSADPSEKEENPGTEKPVENPGETKDDLSGKPATPPVTPSEKPATAPSAPVKVPEKVTDQSAVDRFQKKYDAFMERYQEDQDAISQDEEPANYKTWKEIKDAIVKLLDLSRDLDDDEVQGCRAEIKEIFTDEAAKEFVRLTVELLRELMGTEDEEEGPTDEEIKDVISGSSSEEFVRIVDELLGEINSHSEDDIFADDESENETDPSKDSMAAPLMDEEEFQEETDPEEELKNELLSDAAVSRYVKDVNRLISDTVMVLYDGESQLSETELKEVLSHSQRVANTALQIAGILGNVLDEMQGFGVKLFYTDHEAELKKMVEDFLREMETITDNLSKGLYSSEEELSAAVDNALENVWNAVDNLEYTEEERSDLTEFAGFFAEQKDLLFRICILQNTADGYSLEDLSTEIENQREVLAVLETGMNELALLQNNLDQAQGIVFQYENILNDIIASGELKELYRRINSIYEKLSLNAYDGLQALEEEIESVKEFADSISISDEDAKEHLKNIEAQIQEMVIKRDEFLTKYNNIATDNNASRPEDFNWENISKELEELMYELDRLKSDYYIFSDTEYEGYSHGIAEKLISAALIEFNRQVEAMKSDYLTMTPDELLAKVEVTKEIRFFYLEQLDSSQEERVKALETEIIEVRARAFLSEVERLKAKAEAEGSEYQSYEGYYKFLADTENAKKLLDDELEQLPEELLEQVRKAKEELEKLEEFLSGITTSPEARKTWEKFNREYEALIAEYEDPENPPSWQWKEILLRVTDLQKLASKLPGVFYDKTGEQRQKLSEILSEEAEKEIDAVIKQLEDCEDEAEIRRQVKYGKEVLDYVFGRREELAEKLDWFLEKAEIMGSDLSEEAKEFLEAVRAFEKEVNNKENLDENGKIKDDVLSVLTSSYELLREMYRSLPEEDKDQRAVTMAYENLKELWDAVCRDHMIEADLVNQIYDFLETMDDFRKFYDQKKLWEENPVNLILAYEECVEQCEMLKELLSENSNVPEELRNRFHSEDEYLKSLKDEIEAMKNSLTNATGGLYIVGDSFPEGAEISVPQITMNNAKEFLSLTQNMEGGLAEILSICQRMKELAYNVTNSGNVGSDDDSKPAIPGTTEDVKAIQQEINQLIQEIDRISRTTEYDNWYGLMGGKAYAQTAWSPDEDDNGSIKGAIYNPMRIELEAMTAEALGLKDLDIDGDEAIERLEAAIEKTASYYSELKARQNLSEHIVNVMENWLQNDTSASAQKVGIPDVENTKRYSEIPQDKVIGSSLDNTEKLINNIQTFEGALTESHNILQYMGELEIRIENSQDKLDEIDRFSIEAQLKALSEGLTFIAEYVNYEDWHGMAIEGESHLIVPTGWYTCHTIDISIDNMTAEGLGLDENITLENIYKAINKVSVNRSVLGAWQNVSEHIVELCEITLNVGPLIGNQFTDITDEEGNIHHRPDILTDWFDRIYSDMSGRIRELETKKENWGGTEADIATIDQEIHVLKDGVDILIDLIKSSVQTAPKVGFEPENGNPVDWLTEIIIDENETDYRYKLTYQSVASGTRDVCMVDYIENGDDSCFAGVVRGVDLTEVNAKNIPTKVYVQTSKGVLPTPEEELPQALQEEGGNWILVEDPDGYPDWKYVTAVAFDFGEYSFGIEGGISHYSDVSVEILMSSIYGGKPGCSVYDMPDEGYVLENTCVVYQRIGNNNEVVKTHSGYNTKVLIKYDPSELSMPVHLPTTGGCGTMPFHMAGFAFLAVGIFMMMLKRRDEEEPLF